DPPRHHRDAVGDRLWGRDVWRLSRLFTPDMHRVNTGRRRQEFWGVTTPCRDNSSKTTLLPRPGRPVPSSDVENVHPRSRGPYALGESLVEERDVVGLVSGQPAPDLVPGVDRDPELGLAHDEHRSLALLEPLVPTAIGASGDLEDVAAEPFGQRGR